MLISAKQARQLSDMARKHQSELEDMRERHRLEMHDLEKSLGILDFVEKELRTIAKQVGE